MQDSKGFIKIQGLVMDTDMDNLQILCKSCKSSKGAKIIKGGDYD